MANLLGPSVDIGKYCSWVFQGVLESKCFQSDKILFLLSSNSFSEPVIYENNMTTRRATLELLRVEWSGAETKYLAEKFLSYLS